MRKLPLRALRGRPGLLAAALLVAGLLLGWAPTAEGQTGAKKDGKTDLKQPAPAVISDILVEGVSGADQVAFINQQIEKMWAANKLEPSERSSDYEFIRRASLDLIGRIAKLSEIDQFMRDPAEKRRSMLIERLLASDEYANNLANLWTTLLMTRTGGKFYREEMQLWLFDRFAKKNADWSKIVTALVTATGRTNENGAVNFLLAHMGEEIKEDHRANGRFDMVPVTSRTTKLFLGLRTQCTQCHDHPFNDEWQQHHFWGINAFFRQVDAPNGRPTVMIKKKKGMPASPQHELVDNPSFNVDGIVPYERRNGVVLYQKPTFLDGTRMAKGEGINRRAELAKFITKSPYFSKVFVNRVWGHLFGRGLNKNRDVDDFGEHNELTHPEMLTRLAEDWATKYAHNPRDLIRWICNSRAYGLSSVANPTNLAADAEPFFSRMRLKAMSPEQLFESLMLATLSKAAESRDDRKKLREEWLNKLVLNFGDDEGNEATFNGTVIQALMLMNDQEINTAIMDQKYGTVANVIWQRGVTPRSAMTSLYMAALNRPPTAAEYARILSPRMISVPRVALPRDLAGVHAFYTDFYQDLFWAILNSNEFFLNH